MSFCPHCGAANADGVNFCASCGASLIAAHQQDPPPTLSASANSVLAVVKRTCSSPIVLIALIAYSAAILLNFLNGFIYGLSGSVGYVILFQNIENATAFRIASVVINIFAIARDILTILLLTNLWMIYASAADRQSVGMKTKSLTTIKTILKIYFVFICVALALFGIAVLAFSIIDIVVNHHSIGDTVSRTIAFAIGFRLVILFYTDLSDTIDTIQRTIQTGVPSENISSYVAIISLIPGIFTAIAILLTIILCIVALIVGGSVAAPALVSNLMLVNPLSLIASLCPIIASSAFGVFLFYYRNKIRTAGR